MESKIEFKVFQVHFNLYISFSFLFRMKKKTFFYRKCTQIMAGNKIRLKRKECLRKKKAQKSGNKEIYIQH